MKKSLFLIVFGLQFTLLSAQSVPFQRVATLGKGMAISWLERYWLGDPNRNFDGYVDMNRLQSRKSELLVMKQMGIKTLRLPVWFSGWYSASPTNPTLVTPQYFAAVDSFIQWTNELGMNIILDYHQGSLNSANKNTETDRIANIWKQVAARYATTNPNRVFFEIYNEPNNITSSEWKIAANRIVDAIRTATSVHTLIVGGVQFNDIKYLDSLGTLRDNNIIYTFHFYEPFIFTHQGASWIENGVPVATKGIPFPYNAATMPPFNVVAQNTWGESSYNAYPTKGTVETILNQLKVAFQWQTNNQRPVYCGEFGSDGVNADAASRCLLLKTVRQTLEGWKIPFAWWDWDGEFKMFKGSTPSVSALPECFLDAWGVTSTVVTTPTTNGDISVNLSANVTAYQPYTTINYQIAVKNNSTTPFTNVKIEFVYPTNTTNGGTATPSVGKWSEVCSGGIKCYTWTIPTLAPNATATLTVPLFNLNTRFQIVATTKLLSSVPTDVQTNNNQSILLLNKVTSHAHYLNTNKPTQLIPVVIQSIDPTITEGDMVMQLESIVEREMPFSIVNSWGATVKTFQLMIDKGSNKLPIDVWDLPQGIYFITPDGVKGRKIPMKFVKM